MTKTIFLSFLGTNNYLECIYQYPDNQSVQTKYTQIAVIQKHINEINEFIFFLTEDAKKLNWEGDTKLKSELNKLNIDESKIKNIDIPNGFNNDDLLNIFTKLVDNIPEEANLIIDVTHSFRSLPITLSSVLEYLKKVKNVNIQHIYYGAFEVLGNPRDLQGKPIEERVAPMLDITYLSAIQDWTTAIEHFLEYGNINKLNKLSQSTIKPILIESQGKNVVAASIRYVVEELDKLLQALYTCRIKDIKKSLDNFNTIKSKLDTITSHDNNYILPQIIEPLKKLNKKLDIINENDSKEIRAIKLTQWCIDYNWIQQGYTLLQENLLSYLIVQCGKDSMDKIQRDCLSKTLNIIANKTPEEQWQTNDKEIVAFYFDKYSNQMEICNLYKTLSEYRNDINHAGYRENSMDAKNLAEKLKEFYGKTLSIINLK